MPPKKKSKIRLDQLLLEKGLAVSRTNAQALIVSGVVYSGTEKLTKPGNQVSPDKTVEVRGKEFPWVSRGGVKLDYGLSYFNIKVAGKSCLDIGASTGGFTDVLLERGAKSVVAVDVGYGQLAWKLRNDNRVRLLEKTNARYLNKEIVPEKILFLCCDTSFIGLRKVLPACLDLVGEGGSLIALIKPQFEVEKGTVGKGGIIRDAEQHESVCEDIADWLANYPGWSVIGIAASPINGNKGNKEFLIAANRV